VSTRVRHLREQEILDAALAELRETDAHNISMSLLARRTGISRAAIYQYFSSVSDVFAELVINDMADLVNTIDGHVDAVTEPDAQIVCWVEKSLAHLASGDHAIIRKLSELGLPPEKRGIVQALHGQFMVALLSPIAAMGIGDVEATASFVASTVNAAANRVDRGSSVERETLLATTYVMSALHGMRDVPAP
jgi:AcrR family transcriptional regulator